MEGLPVSYDSMDLSASSPSEGLPSSSSPIEGGPGCSVRRTPSGLLSEWVVEDMLAFNPQIGYRSAVSLLSNKLVHSPMIVNQSGVVKGRQATHTLAATEKDNSGVDRNNNSCDKAFRDNKGLSSIKYETDANKNTTVVVKHSRT